METLQRTKSDISAILLHTKEMSKNSNDPSLLSLPTVLSEVEAAKCECCGMSEELSADYIGQVRKKFSGRLICGLCAEEVKEVMGKKKNCGKTREDALEEHMNACVKFNKFGKAYPDLYQAEEVKNLLKRSSNTIKKCATTKGGVPPRRGGGGGGGSGGGGLARSTSCLPSIVKDMQDKLTVSNGLNNNMDHSIL